MIMRMTIHYHNNKNKKKQKQARKQASKRANTQINKQTTERTNKTQTNNTRAHSNFRGDPKGYLFTPDASAAGLGVPEDVLGPHEATHRLRFPTSGI